MELAEKFIKKIENGGLTFGLCLLSVMILPTYIHYLPPVMILWVIFWVIENRSGFNTSLVRDNRAAILFLLFWPNPPIFLPLGFGLGALASFYSAFRDPSNKRLRASDWDGVKGLVKMSTIFVLLSLWVRWPC